MLTGGCLCGAVRFEIAGTLGPIIYCHCSMCRRATGSAFATNASVLASAFRIVAGASSITEYESSAGSVRAFCARCGSPLYGRMEAYPFLRRVRLGTLDGDPGGRSVANIWVGSKAEWFTVADGLEPFEAEPPDAYGAPGA